MSTSASEPQYTKECTVSIIQITVLSVLSTVLIRHGHAISPTCTPLLSHVPHLQFWALRACVEPGPPRQRSRDLPDPDVNVDMTITRSSKIKFKMKIKIVIISSSFVACARGLFLQ